MGRIPNPTCLLIVISILLFSPTSNSEEQEGVKKSLIRFVQKLSGGNKAISKRWNMTSDACEWVGVTCDPNTGLVWTVVLEGLNLSGTLDAASACRAESLLVLKLKNNNLTGSIPSGIGNCHSLIWLDLSGNRFTGSVPDTVANMTTLLQLEISGNRLTGEVPDLSRLMLLRNFLAQENRLRGSVPVMNFDSLQGFNVSDNRFQGRIPDGAGKFGADSFLGNSGLCGAPLPNACSDDAGSPAVAAAAPAGPIDPPTVDVSGGVEVQGNGILMLLVWGCFSLLV
ncbi:unnamed protein product [Linum tenue]|uniref:Leucine-rich repeat-containing N-terminal plant-type domain-containing protein n=1 Tax=Linum tenue TaxID=586396 RepID=A0AAV0HW57_9ROSI|nr:unnamed protein product [Linum tenue]